MDIAVVNLMRFGDLIQTSPVLRRLRAEHPGGRISLVAMDVAGEAAGLLPGADRVVLFPSVTLAANLDQEGNWPEAVAFLSAWLRDNFPRPPDLVINLTPTCLGGVLAFCTGAREIRGLIATPRWELVTRPSWASYALIASRARQANPFNVVDLFLREAGLRPDGRGLEVEVPPPAEEEAEEFLRSLRFPEDALLIGLMPGASQPERCWPPEFFARSARMLLERRLHHFFIFGSVKEAPLGEAIARELPPGAVTLLTGRTSPALLAAYLKRLALLITNDTGPMHLAAAVGTPTLSLFLATARVQDTGPVGRGHVILEPRLECHPCLNPCPGLRCLRTISPEAVAWWAGRLLAPDPPDPLEQVDLWPALRVSRSGVDPQGYHAYLPLVRRPLSRRDFWLWVQRLGAGPGSALLGLRGGPPLADEDSPHPLPAPLGRTGGHDRGMPFGGAAPNR